MCLVLNIYALVMLLVQNIIFIISKKSGYKTALFTKTLFYVYLFLTNGIATGKIEGFL